MGISKSHDFIQNFGFEKSRLPSDLSLALGSGNFSPAEMARAFGVIANGGYLVDPYYISKIEDRDGNIIYSHNDYVNLNDNAEIKAFPWLNTLEMNIKKPYFLINPKLQKDPVFPAISSLFKKEDFLPAVPFCMNSCNMSFIRNAIRSSITGSF